MIVGWVGGGGEGDVCGGGGGWGGWVGGGGGGGLKWASVADPPHPPYTHTVFIWLCCQLLKLNYEHYQNKNMNNKQMASNQGSLYFNFKLNPESAKQGFVTMQRYSQVHSWLHCVSLVVLVVFALASPPATGPCSVGVGRSVNTDSSAKSGVVPCNVCSFHVKEVHIDPGTEAVYGPFSMFLY